jgi:hypothetical protein
MRIFLSTKDTIQEATALVLKHIQESYDGPKFVEQVNSGLVDITYFGSDDTAIDSENAPPPIKDESTAGTNAVTEENDTNTPLGLSSLLLVAVGSATLIAFVGAVYFYKRGRKNDDEDGVHSSSASQFASVTLNDAAPPGQDSKDDPNIAARPASPYSEMISGAYRLDGLQEMSILSSSNMSPVYEMEGNETDNDTVVGGTSIMISEGGYTTDAGGTEEGDSTMFDSTTVGGSKYSSHSTPNVLGARPFPGTIGNIEMEEVSDSDLDTSGEMSPVKLYVGNALMNTSKQNKLLVLPSGKDPMDDENEDHDDSLLFGSPAPSSKDVLTPSTKVLGVDDTNALFLQHNLSAPTDELFDSDRSSSSPSNRKSRAGDIESAVGSMSLTSPMSQNTAHSF